VRRPPDADVTSEEAKTRRQLLVKLALVADRRANVEALYADPEEAAPDERAEASAAALRGGMGQGSNDNAVPGGKAPARRDDDDGTGRGDGIALGEATASNDLGSSGLSRGDRCLDDAGSTAESWRRR
jgi:hypothetical protein